MPRIGRINIVNCNNCKKEIDKTSKFCPSCGYSAGLKEDYYDILGIPRNSSKDDIKKSYYILAKQYHPDKNNGNEKRFKKINEAYRILHNEITRKRYDEELKSGGKNSSKNSSRQNQPNREKTSDNQKDEEKRKHTISKFILGGAFIILVIAVLASVNKPSEDLLTNENLNPLTSNNIREHQKAQTSPSGGISREEFELLKDDSVKKMQSGKCVTEYGTKICDLSFSATPSNPNINSGYRDVYSDGNTLACVDMITGDAFSNTVGSIRASRNSSFCVSDIGTIYIDPDIQVSKYWGEITRGGFNSPYIVNFNYDICVWSYTDGNGAIPYVEILGNVGPRSGYSPTAFCKNGNNQLDIYSYKNI